MAFTFSIKKGYEILLEITACEEVFSNDSLPHLIQQCFEKIFQLIEEKRQEDKPIEKDEGVLDEESSEGSTE